MDKPTIVYDSHCPFCISQIERIKRWDSHTQFDYVSAHSADLGERFPTLAQMQLNEGMRLVFPDGSVAVGADAVYEIALRLPATHLVARLYRLPILRPLAKFIYAFVAKNRHLISKLMGKPEAKEQMPADLNELEYWGNPHCTESTCQSESKSEATN